jgi:O-antigen chain-terminating methyltransferase
VSAGFYRAFEDRYRGTREVIKQRLAAYQPFLSTVAAQAAAAGRPATALDLGCGRGEWLELLGEQGVDARGVDLDDGMLAACRERGLAAEHADAVASLRARPDDSLDLVSAFHLVEHIPFDVLQTLIAEARRVLRPGGLLIMETPNPENLSVGATSFYLDPSHERPLPPLLLGFLTEYSGYARQRIVRLQEAPRLHGDADVGLIDVLEGVSPDYAIVAQKAGPAPLLTPFDAAFARPYGFALGDMAQRYEQLQARRRAALHGALARHDAELHGLSEGLAGLNQGLSGLSDGLTGLAGHTAALRARLPGIDAELAQLEQRAGRGEAALDALAARLDQAQARAEAADARADAHARHVAELLASSSWRITAPWRMAGHYAHRLRGALREGRVLSGVKRRLRGPLLALMRAALRRPRVKRAARALLRFSPSLQARLAGLLQQSAAAQTVLPAEPPQPPGDMSPRTLRHYRNLKSSLETRKH